MIRFTIFLIRLTGVVAILRVAATAAAQSPEYGFTLGFAACVACGLWLRLTASREERTAS